MSYREFRKKYRTVGLVVGLAVVTSAVVITACTDQAKAKLNIIFKEKDPNNPDLIAKIGDKTYTREQVVGDDKLQLQEILTREFEFYQDHVKKAAVDALIGAEAKKANMSLDEFISKKIAGNIKVSEKDYKAFITERHIPEAQIKPEIKERINSYIQGMKRQELIDAYLAKMTKNSPIEIFMKKPKMMVNVEVGNAPTFGKKDAPVTIVVFSDFQCPFCSRAAETVTQIKKKYKDKVLIAFRQFPLPMHKDARPAAEASMCVNEQGSDKFWKYHDILFKNQDKLDKANLEKFAKDSGADVKKFNECVTAKKYADFVQKEMEYGEKIGVKSTPTFFVNGQLLSGAVPIENFSDVIDDEIAEKKGK